MTDETQTPGIGHNMSPFEELKALMDQRIAEADRAISQYPEIPDQETADRFTSLIDAIRACEKEAEKLRKEEKAPLDQKIKDIQERYRMFTDRLGTAAGALKKRLTAFLVAEQQRREAERKAAEEEAMRVMQEAEDRRKSAEETGSVSAQIAAEEAQREAEQAVKVTAAPVGPARARGENSARSIGLRTTYSAVIEDQDAVYRHFRNDPKVKDVLQQLANAEARAAKGDRAAFTVPGAVLHEDKVAA